MADYSPSQFNRNFKTTGIKAAWWKEDRTKLHESVGPLIDALRDEQRDRDRQNHQYLSMFFGHRTSGIQGNRYSVRSAQTQQLRVNLARSIASAANSKLAKDKIRVLYLTEGGNWWQQTRGKRMTKVINGTFHSSGFYDENSRAQLDSCVFDIGAVYFWTEGKSVKCKRVPGHEIRVDAMDARYGAPTQLFREVVVPRSVLMAKYPSKKSDIDAAPVSDGMVQTGSHWVSDCVDVVMAWHLPSGPDEDDGKFCVVLPNATLESSDYEQDFFPFVFHVWEVNPLGFYGQSICSELVGIQYNINKVVQDIQEHCDLSTGFVAIESGSQFNKQALTNEIWRVCEYSATPPQYVTPPSFQTEKVDWLNWLVNRGHEDTGLSQLFVTSRKPEGLDSGKALREYADQNSERFQMAQQRYQDSHVQAAKIIAGLYEEIYQEEGNFKVPVFGQKHVEMIDWEQARLDEENYTVRPVPTSFLPTTPAAKLQTVQEMLQGGLLSLEDAKRLLDYPDLEQVNNLQMAPLLNIESKLDKMLDPDDPEPQDPDPLGDLAMMSKMALAAYAQAESQGAPEENLQLVRNFITQIDDILTQSQEPDVALQGPTPGQQDIGQGAAPMAGPEGPPGALGAIQGVHTPPMPMQ